MRRWIIYDYRANREISRTTSRARADAIRAADPAADLGVYQVDHEYLRANGLVPEAVDRQYTALVRSLTGVRVAD